MYREQVGWAVEEGLIVTDPSLRLVAPKRGRTLPRIATSELAARYPEAWRRIERRRAFMADQLGIELHPDVLPLSNLPAHLPPFLLRPDRAMTVAS